MDLIQQLIQLVIILIVLIAIVVVIPFIFMLVFSFAYVAPPPAGQRPPAVATVPEEEADTPS
jgi:hypothetical protein